MYFSHLKKTISENITPIIFFGMVFFAGVSIWNIRVQEERTASRLLEYTNTVISKIRSGTSQLSNNSLILTKEEQNFEIFKAEITNLINEINSLKSTTPSLPRDTNSEELAKQLHELMNDVVSDLQFIFSRTEFVQYNVKTIEELTDFRFTMSEGSVTEIVSHIESLKEINKAVEDQNYTEIELYVDRIYLNGLSEVLENIQQFEVYSMSLKDGNELTPEIRENLKNLTQNWSDKKEIPFPIFQKSEIEDEGFFQAVNILKDLFETIKQSYNL